MPGHHRVVVVGGGISGLTAAHHLRRVDPSIDVVVLERTHRVGGMVNTEHWEGRTIELGPEGFVTNRPEALALVEELGLTDELVVDGPAPRRTFVARRGDLVPLPYGILNPDRAAAAGLLRSPLLSLRAKARMALEPLVPRRRDVADESVASWVRRRFGAGLLDSVVDPLIGGIHGGGTTELSAEMLLPALRRIELEGSSVALTALRRGSARPSGARSEPDAPGGTGSGAARRDAKLPPLVTLRRGMGSLTDALAAELGDALLLGVGVASLERCGIAGATGWRLVLDGDRAAEVLEADAVVLATPASVSARLLEPHDPHLAEALRALHWSGSTTVTLVWEVGDADLPDTGTGYLVPASEGGPIAASSWVTGKWHHRSDDGSAMVRCFVRPDAAGADDDTLVSMARAEVAARTGVTAAPRRTIVWRVPDALPKVTVGHRERSATVHVLADALGGISLAGAGLEGSGLPACIRSGRRAADTARTALRRTATV